MLAGPHIIDFLRILQKLSNILHPSRQNWKTEVCFFCKRKIIHENIWANYFSFLTLSWSQWKLLVTPYIIPPCCKAFETKLYIPLRKFKEAKQPKSYFSLSKRPKKNKIINMKWNYSKTYHKTNSKCCCSGCPSYR